MRHCCIDREHVEHYRLKPNLRIGPISPYCVFNWYSIPLGIAASAAFAENAKRLSIDIGAVDTMALSHCTSDQGGGLLRFFELNARRRSNKGAAPAGERFCQMRVLPTKGMPGMPF